MIRQPCASLLIPSAVALIGCCGTSPPPLEATPEPVAPPPQVAAAPPPAPPPAPVVAPDIWMSPKEVEEACAAGIGKARALREKIVAVLGTRTEENTLSPVNDLLIELYNVLTVSELLANVHPDKAVRDASETCQQEAAKVLTEFTLDRSIYDAVSNVDPTHLDEVTRRFVTLLIRDYHLYGVHKDEVTRKKLADLREAMVKTGQDFSREIREDKRFIEVDEMATAGLPEEFVEAHKTGKGTYRFTTDYPDFMPVASYAEKEKTRKALYLEYLNRAVPANQENLKRLLALRYEYATLLGYSDWAEYNAKDKMARDKETVATFIDKVADIARPRMKDDVRAMLRRKKRDLPGATAVRAWDRFYYANRIRAEKYGVDAKELRKYFAYTRVLEGILALNERLFGVTFEKVEAPVWHEEVEAYNVVEDGKTVGRFYLDMHPREGKYTHAAEFGMLPGIPGRQLPSAALVCNFPRPAEGVPALLEHDQVVTVLHELGHLMHQIIAGRHPWVTLTGIACERDFVEVPSQLLEHWGWSFEVLKELAIHHETGETIPEELVAKMNEADKFGQGAQVMRQMFYAGLSYTYHASDPAGMDLDGVVREMQKKYSPYPYEKNTHVYASFGHLEGYSSLYYTYMWSLALSEDLFLRFKNEGIMNPETAADYRKKVLEPGGTVDAMDMVTSFLGREHTFDALAAYLNDK